MLLHERVQIFEVPGDTGPAIRFNCFGGLVTSPCCFVGYAYLKCQVIQMVVIIMPHYIITLQGQVLLSEASGDTGDEVHVPRYVITLHDVSGYSCLKRQVIQVMEFMYRVTSSRYMT